MKFYTNKKVFSPDEIQEEYRVMGCKYDSQHNVYNLLAYDGDEKLHRISIMPDEDEEIDEYNILDRGWEDWYISVLTPEDIYYFFG